MAHSTDTRQPEKAKQTGVKLRLNPASMVDQYGDLLSKGDTRTFTEAEAAQLLRVRNPHGAPVFQRVKG
jgi:hypothetical protein